MSAPPPPPTPARQRVAALDAARALGVFAMVYGHTCDALLSPVARRTPFMVQYWKARGITAPLFMLVAGWAVSLAVARAPDRGLGIVRARLPRVLLLLIVGYALRFPGWDLDGLLTLRGPAWEHLLAFDALHAIAAGLLVAALAFALPLSRRERGLLFLLLVALAVTLGMRDPAPLPPRSLPASLPALAVTQAFGGSSPFAAVPWAGYFFAGCALALLAGEGPRRTRALGFIGGALVLATFWTGVGEMPPGHPVLFAYRVGVVFLVLAALAVVPERLARALAPLGRASLAVYALHVPLVYGWSTHDGLAQRLGPHLTASGASLAAALVLLASLAITVAWGRLATAVEGALRTPRAAGEPSLEVRPAPPVDGADHGG